MGLWGEIKTKPKRISVNGCLKSAYNVPLAYDSMTIVDGFISNFHFDDLKKKCF